MKRLEGERTSWDVVRRIVVRVVEKGQQMNGDVGAGTDFGTG